MLVVLVATLLLWTSISSSEPKFAIPSSAIAASTVNPPSFDIAGMNASMRSAYAWVLSKSLSNGTATLSGLSNKLLSTSLVGRVLTYVQLEIGNATSLGLIRKMINSEHVLLQNPNYIAFGIWPTQTLLTQLQIHRDVQKFLLRAYGLTLDQTARSDLVSVTQDIYLNRPGHFEYFDTIAWSLANSVWFAFYNRTPLPPSSDFTGAVQDLKLQYNLTAARADSASSFVDYSRLLHYVVPLEYTDSYFKIEGLSLDQTYQNLETQVADQLITRQLSDGDVYSAKPYKSYLVEDFARDLDSAYYLKKNPTYALSAFKAESFLTGLYLQPSGNMSLPNSGDGLAPHVAFHMISIANDIRPSSTSDWYSALYQASKIINYTVSIQNPDGTFNFYLNSTNPGFAFTTIASVSTIADSYVVLRNSAVLSAISTQTASTSSTVSGSTSGGTTTTSNNPGSGQPLPLSGIPSWVYIIIPILLVILVAVAYEGKHKSKRPRLVDK